MINKILFSLIITCSSFCIAQEKTAVSTKHNYPEFSWDTMPLYMHLRKTTAFTKEEIKFIAKHPLITFEKTTGSRTYGSTEAGTIKAAEAVKKTNPNTKILYYKNVVINWPSYQEDEAFLKKHPEAILVDEKGKKALMTNNKTGFFDLSQENVRNYWIDHVAKITSNPYIDGIFMDANIKVLVPSFFKSRVGDAKQKELETGYLSMMNQLNTRLGKDNLLIANILRVRPEFKDVGREYLKFFNGSYLEGFEHESFGMSYADYLAKGIEAVQKSAREGNVIAMSLGLGEAGEHTVVGFDDQRKEVVLDDSFSNRLDYLLAIFLVCAEKYSYVYPHDGYSVNERRDGKGNDSSVWLKTFPQYKKKLGAPKGPAQKEGYVYTRSFEYLDVTLDIEKKTATLDWK
ncbi:putative glycoside hydrolase [Wenyingzhuangia sp. 2_MG-2023]|uniref:putative glycoside hydrolase n=1 Tax=Wenyingzhuangia sp. 2_MG-2023 TaxID=3062639 RepID=UPI0026E31F83|nr:putative glycoside hydrolase [Wenyingzhuangia sp. 2_MG-2023]MDO6736303.1 putative glycoside hydrolase [Wenyingzhuangia sp. 2_MG-2023]